MSLKSKIRNAVSLEEAEKIFNKETRNLITVWSKIYPDYAGNFSEHIKTYQSKEGYVAVVKTFNDRNVVSLEFYFTPNKPREPHPVFPMPHTYLSNFQRFAFYSKGL